MGRISDPGGRLVINVQPRSPISLDCLSSKSPFVLEMPPLGRLRVTGKEYLKTFVREAGLGVGKRFGSKRDESAGVWEGSDEGKVFDRFLEGPVGAMIG